MLIEIAIINGALVDNYTHKFKKKQMIYLKYYIIVGVVEKKT